VAGRQCERFKNSVGGQLCRIVLDLDLRHRSISIDAGFRFVRVIEIPSLRIHRAVAALRRILESPSFRRSHQNVLDALCESRYVDFGCSPRLVLNGK
jgi:hypothetical protein